MPTQRLTVAKIAGPAADAALEFLRRDVDGFADVLRANGYAPPIVSFAEWADGWTMGDTLAQWLLSPRYCEGVRHEVYAYDLSDGGRLAAHLDAAGPQQFAEYDRYVARLREAVSAWDGGAGRSLIVVVRHVFGPSATDDEVRSAVAAVPGWLA